MTANQISFGLPALQHTTTKGVNKRETKDENKLRRKRNVSTFELTVSTVIRSTARPGAKPGTIHREVAALSHLFTKAVEWKWLTGSLATIKRLAEDFGRISSLTVEKTGRLIEAVKLQGARLEFVMEITAQRARPSLGVIFAYEV